MENFCLSGSINIKYKHYNIPGDSPFFTIQKDFYRKGHFFDFIWICTDLACPNFAEIFKILPKAKEKQISCILTNPFSAGSFKNKKEEILVSSPALLNKYKEEIVTIGGVLVSGKLAFEMSENAFNKITTDFWQFSAVAHLFAERRISIMVLSENLFYYNNRPPHFCATDFKTDILDFWVNQWYDTVINLPAEYQEMRQKLLNIDDEFYSPIQLMNLIYWRTDKTYSKKNYKKIKQNIPYVTFKSLKRIALIANAPVFLCQWLIKHQHGRIMRAIIEIYRICFTKSEM